MNNNEVIITALIRIETKLDEVIAALHAYDDDGYGESSFESFMDSKQSPCVKHDEASWDEEERLNKRMDIIGQNGNEGSHYVTNEEADEDAMFNDYGMRVEKNNDNNTQGKRGGKKNKRKVDPIVKHEQFRQPHKH
jgi:hypothetical protein